MHFVKIDRRHRIQTPPFNLMCARSSQTSGWVTLTALYESQWRLVLWQALHITQSRQAAEDIAQDVFAYAWHQSGSYDCSRGSLPTWLSMLCRSRAIDYLRSESNGRKMVDHDADLELIPDDQLSADAKFDYQLLREALRVALGALPKQQKQLLKMHYYSELSHAEIATLTGLPLGTIKTTIRRAKIALGRNRTLRSFRAGS